MSLMPYSEIPSEIKVEDLRRWGAMFFDMLEAQGHTTIPLKHGYYWSLTPADPLYDPNVRPDFDELDDLFDNLRDVISEERAPEDERILCTLQDYTALLAYIGTGLPLQSNHTAEGTA